MIEQIWISTRFGALYKRVRTGGRPFPFIRERLAEPQVAVKLRLGVVRQQECEILVAVEPPRATDAGRLYVTGRAPSVE